MNVVIQRGTCNPMFIAAMSTIAKLWKEPRFPSTDEWIKKMGYTHTHTHTHKHTHVHIHIHIHTMECYSAIRKDEYLPFTLTH